MIHSNQSLKIRWRNITIFFTIFLLLIFVQDVLREFFVFRAETRIIAEEIKGDLEYEVEDHVEGLLVDIDSILTNLQEDALEHAVENIQPLKLSLHNIEDILSNLGESYLTHMIDVVQVYNSNDTMHTYSLLEIDGTLLYDGETNTTPNTNIMNQLDDLNRPYMNDLIDLIVENEKDSISYYQDDQGRLVHNIIYGERIQNTDYIVISIVNLDIFSGKMKEDFISLSNEKYNNLDRNIFIISYDGVILSHAKTDLIGLDKYSIENPLLVNALINILELIEEKGSGLTEYPYYVNFNEDQVEKRIAYAEDVEEWEIIIASSVSINKYNSILEAYTDQNYVTMALVKVPSYFVLLILAMIIYTYLKQTMVLSLAKMHDEEILYRKFADLTSEIIMITDIQGRIIFTNDLGKKTIYGKRNLINDVYFDQILVEEEGYYILYGYIEDFYVKYITEEIDYNGEEAHLYIVTDVTDKIKTEKKLEALSMVDELTKLGNRRLMIKEYNEIVLDYIKKGRPAYLSMIDLDDFKLANDTYGHSYGDKVLHSISKIFIENLDENSKIYRIGGDEFAMISMNMGIEEVVNTLNLIREKVEVYDYEKPIDISFSAGISEIKVNDEKRRFSDYYDRADELLYKAKKQGKHKISI